MTQRSYLVGSDKDEALYGGRVYKGVRCTCAVLEVCPLEGPRRLKPL